jgi:DNA-directed RNA polymerase subunit RPC12/RpoP
MTEAGIRQQWPYSITKKKKFQYDEHLIFGSIILTSRRTEGIVASKWRNAMNCRNCGARMRFVWDRDYFLCEYCKTCDFPEEGPDSFRIVDERSGLYCPACGAELQIASLLKMRALHCGNCRGFLMKQDRFRILVSNLRASATDPPAVPGPVDRKELLRQVRCPHCLQEMDTQNQGRSRPRPPDGAVRLREHLSHYV